MQDDDNPYRVTGLVEECKAKDSSVWIWVAKACAILPFVYMLAEIIELERIGNDFSHKIADQHTIFIVGTWFYALISIPAAILIIFRTTRAGLCYGIIINMLFALIAFWGLHLSWNVEPPMTQGHYFPALFGLPTLLVRFLYVVMYVGTICVYIMAWRCLNREKRKKQQDSNVATIVINPVQYDDR